LTLCTKIKSASEPKSSKPYLCHQTRFWLANSTSDTEIFWLFGRFVHSDCSRRCRRSWVRGSVQPEMRHRMNFTPVSFPLNVALKHTSRNADNFPNRARHNASATSQCNDSEQSGLEHKMDCDVTGEC